MINLHITRHATLHLPYISLFIFIKDIKLHQCNEVCYAYIINVIYFHAISRNIFIPPIFHIFINDKLTYFHSHPSSI